MQLVDELEGLQKLENGIEEACARWNVALHGMIRHILQIK
jgi:hypothetical protein